MADHSRTPQRGLSDPARTRGFYATLRSLERARPDVPRIGRAAHPRDEAFRLGQEPSMAFEAAPIVSRHEPEGSAPARIGVSFFGMFGPSGPLPLHLTEHAYQRRHQYRDATFARFADIFHHRLLSYLYRAWADAQPTVSADRPHDDHFASYVGALSGQGFGHPPSELDATALGAAGHFVASSRHAEGLEKLLSEALRVPAQVEEFVGCWLRIPDEYCWRIAAGTTQTERPLGVLGETSRVGTESWDQQGKFRVVLGPLSRNDHARFQPGGEDLTRLIALVHQYTGRELAWELRLVLEERALQPAVLGQVGAIGRTAYIGGSEARASWQDLQFDPLAEAS